MCCDSTHRQQEAGRILLVGAVDRDSLLLVGAVDLGSPLEGAVDRDSPLLGAVDQGSPRQLEGAVGLGSPRLVGNRQLGGIPGLRRVGHRSLVQVAGQLK